MRGRNKGFYGRMRDYVSQNKDEFSSLCFELLRNERRVLEKMTNVFIKCRS